MHACACVRACVCVFMCACVHACVRVCACVYSSVVIGSACDKDAVLCTTSQGLLKELVANCDGALKSEVTQVAAEYEHRLQLGSKVIYHIEAFVARFMAIYKGFMEEGMADMMVM